MMHPMTGWLTWTSHLAPMPTEKLDICPAWDKRFMLARHTREEIIEMDRYHKEQVKNGKEICICG